MSLPVRGAWIEILAVRPPEVYTPRRSPCGERGLKFGSPLPQRSGIPSLPVRGAWIEIRCKLPETPLGLVAPRAGSVD